MNLYNAFMVEAAVMGWQRFKAAFANEKASTLIVPLTFPL